MIGLACAVAAMLCYGVGSVLQAVAARRTTVGSTLDPRLLLRLGKSWLYLLGVALDGVGFVLTLAAVRTAPLFLVQAVVAGFLGVAAVLGALVFRTPLHRLDRAALLAVTAGLVLLALAAAPERTGRPVAWLSWAVLLVTAALVPLAMVIGRRAGGWGVGGLGAVAGLAFGATSVGARVVTTGTGSGTMALVVHLALQPATWAIVLGGVVGQLAYATALQRGSLTRATAPLVVAETVVPALVGVALLSDRPRAGWTELAVLGFVLAVGGAVSLARRGEPSAPSSATHLERTA